MVNSPSLSQPNLLCISKRFHGHFIPPTQENLLCKIQTTKEPHQPPKCAPFPWQCYFINEITQFPFYVCLGSVHFGFSLFNDDAQKWKSRENVR